MFVKHYKCLLPRFLRGRKGSGGGKRRGRKVSAFLPESFTCFERVIVCKDLTLGRLRRTDFDVSNGLCIRPPTKLEFTSFFPPRPRGAFYFPLRIIRRIKAPSSAPPPSICGRAGGGPDFKVVSRLTRSLSRRAPCRALRYPDPTKNAD